MVGQTLAEFSEGGFPPLPGGIVGVPMSGGGLCLLPSRRDQKSCQALLLRCRQLCAVREGAGKVEPRLPGSETLTWLAAPDAGLLPVPRLPMPGGEPLDRWLRDPGADSAGLLTALAETAELVDTLAGQGWLPGSLDLRDVWVAGGHLAWLPAALLWQRRWWVATGETLAAGSRTVAVFLHRLLTAARSVPGISAVWEELWALCHDLLENGYGLNAVTVQAALAPLHRRCVGEESPPTASESVLVLVDAGGIQRELRRRALDLTGLVRHLLGGQLLCRGAVLTEPGLPSCWEEEARRLRLHRTSGDLRSMTESELREGADRLLVLCGRAADVAPELPWLRARFGQVAALSSEGAVAMPAPWQLLQIPARLAPWYRIG